ncbi:hypothetical protein ABQE23_09565 [Enterococcus avium]|uniref:hypothetical protein n=1 Tax=Enterococcus avium TaxID=33945 RepID=UPI0032E38F61
MKFSPLSIMKKKYTFEFIQEQNIETEEIEAADHLICWVEEENARIIDEESNASVVVVKRDKKGNILYAQSLGFPMDSETDFDSLLDKFYTRKPIKFDQSILDDSPEPVNQSIPVPKIPGVTTAPVSTQQEQVAQSYAAVPPMPVAGTPEVGPDPATAIEIQELIAAQKAQQEEIQKLKQQLEEERKAAASVSAIAPEIMATPTKEEKQFKSEKQDQLNSLSIGTPKAGTTNKYLSFETVEPETDLSFQDRIDLFIEQEKQKIETEIIAVDQRELIETEVMLKIKEEKEALISRSEMELYEKQAAAIEKEEKRHAAELEKINQEYENQIVAKSKMIEDTFKRRAAAEIRAEYNRQTKELKQIFDERMVELKKHQSELSSKLMKNIKSTFSSLDLEIDEQKQEPEQEKPPVLAELKTIRAGE